jgi:hypothetical protein
MPSLVNSQITVNDQIDPDHLQTVQQQHDALDVRRFSLPNQTPFFINIPTVQLHEQPKKKE